MEDLIARATRVRGLRFVGRCTEILMGDGKERWWIVLPTQIRGRTVTTLEAFLRLELERPIERRELD